MMSKLYPKLQTGGLVPDKSQKTILTLGQQLAYERWKAENKYNESDDYDLAGYWKEEGMKGLQFPNLAPIEKFKEIESKDFPQLDDFYKNNKNTAGMYHGDGTISRNLYSDRHPKALDKVMELEKMRGVLAENEKDPNLPKLDFKLRREDNRAFKTNKQQAINENPESKKAFHYIDADKKTRRETVASRIYIGDALLNQKTNSYVEPSKEQVKQTKRLIDYAHTKPYHLIDRFKRLAPFSNGDGYIHISEESKYSGNPSYRFSDKEGNPINTSFDKRGQGFWKGNEFIAYNNGGTISQLGYKRHSPYNQAPSLLIHTPTGSITMKEVDHPILGIAQGEIKIMHPEKEYQFKSNKILEIPMKSIYPKKYQQGGRSPKVYTDKAEFLKAKQMYDDSLSSYNWGENTVKKIIKTGFSLSGKDVIDRKTQHFIPASKEFQNKLQEYQKIDPSITLQDVKNDFYRLDKNGIHAKGVERFYHQFKPKDVENKGYSDVHVYKKPVQPVIYQQPEQQRMSEMTPVQTIQPQVQATLVQRPITMKTIYPSKPHVWNTYTPPTKKVERAPGLGGYNRIYQQGGTTPEMSPEQQQEVVRRVRNLRKTIGYNKTQGVPLDVIALRHKLHVNKHLIKQEDQELLGAFDENQILELMNNVPDDDQPMYKKGGRIGVKSKMYPKCKCGCGGVSVGKNKMFQNGGMTPTDSLRHQASKIMDYEALRGSQYGTGLPNYGNPQIQSGDKQGAVNYFMNNVTPYLNHFKSAMEKGEAGDFVYNTGRDPRIYMLDQFIKSKGNQQGLPNRGSYNLDMKSPEWGNKKQEFEKEWSKYSNDIQNLPENQRRVLLNKGRDFYYQNIDKQNGQPNPAYKNTWYGRIWNTNDFKPFNPSNPNFSPKFQNGGTMDVLDEDGNSQMTISGGERIFSRVATKRMRELNDNKNYKELGKFICSELTAQDKREPEYVKE